MSNSKSKAPQGGESLSAEAEAQLALLAKARELGLLDDITAIIEEKESQVKIAKANGTIQTACDTLKDAMAEFDLSDTALYVEWDKEGKFAFRFPIKRRKNVGGGGGQIALYKGKLYQTSARLAQVLKIRIPPSWEYGAATYMRRPHKGEPLCGKIEFESLTKAQAKKSVAEGKVTFYEGDFLSE